MGELIQRNYSRWRPPFSVWRVLPEWNKPKTVFILNGVALGGASGHCAGEEHHGLEHGRDLSEINRGGMCWPVADRYNQHTPFPRCAAFYVLPFGFGKTAFIARSNAAPDSSVSSFFAICKKRADCAGSVVGVFRNFFLLGLDFAGICAHLAFPVSILSKQLSYM
jgi:hypothetical protein